MLRIELLTLAILTVLIFLLVILQAERGWVSAILLTILFVALYMGISFAIQKYRKDQEHYQLSPTHLQVTRKSRNKTKSAKVALKDIKHHKLDHTFLGGYLLTHGGKKHLLFFNTKDEVKKFESFLKKHLTLPRKKKK